MKTPRLLLVLLVVCSAMLEGMTPIGPNITSTASRVCAAPAPLPRPKKVEIKSLSVAGVWEIAKNPNNPGNEDIEMEFTLDGKMLMRFQDKVVVQGTYRVQGKQLELEPSNGMFPKVTLTIISHTPNEMVLSSDKSKSERLRRKR